MCKELMLFMENNKSETPYTFTEFVEKVRLCGAFTDGDFNTEITASMVVVFIKEFKNIKVGSIKEGLIKAYSEYLNFKYSN